MTVQIAPSSLTPIQQTDRITSLDIMRGVVILGILIMNINGFGLFGQLKRFELLYVVFAIWIFQLIISPIWLKYFQFGPMEWVWRSLSYMQKPNFKKNKK